jgi:Amt family ammonium transporter
MKRNLLLFVILAFVFAVGAPQLRAADAPKKTDPTLEQRVADLEAYVNNSARQADTGTNNVTSNIPGPGPGHNAWQMTSAALVLFMTLPGLALFYGGLVRRKNILSVVAQCFYLAGLVTILWFVCGYSLSFHKGTPFLGNWDFSFFKGVDSTPNNDYSPWVSHNVFAMYQLMFAIITPALIIGSIAERMKFSAICLFMILWMFVVYFPQAHMIWGVDGFMNGVGNSAAKIHAIDFAGGTVCI